MLKMMETAGRADSRRMIVLEVEGIQKHFGPEPVLDGVCFEVRAGERIALVGPNGSGKTTLLKILAGQEEPDTGSCRARPSVRIDLLEQQPRFSPGRTVWEEAENALAGLVALQREAIQTAQALGEATDEVQRRRLAARFDHLQQTLHRHDAYNLDHKIRRVLEGLGFPRSRYHQPVDCLSGGEQNRLLLARLLLAQPDLMLLDEPSNHLDIEATQWLEEFLASGPAAMILVSHDRYFLDKVATRTLELYQGTVESYPGNFSAYLKQKEQRLLVQRRTYQKQQAEIEKAEDFIRRHAYGQKHAQAEDRKKKLERIERVPPPREIHPPPMRFPPAARSGDVVIRAEGISRAYGRTLFEDLSVDILRGQRWAVLGPNGCGKTTLLRCLVGQLPPDHGRVTIGHGVVVGYFDQHLQCLDDESPAVDAIRPEGSSELDEPARRDLLARFGISGSTALQKVGSLSGGERCRVALARLAAARANLLVLDEPTNHLDLWALEALGQALQRFDGTVLLVSHDRYFINQVADHLIVAQQGRFQVIEGNYQTYQHLVAKGSAGAAQAESTSEPVRPPKAAKAPAPARNKPRRKRRFPFRKVEDLEEEIFRREAHLESLHHALTQPDTYRDGQRVRQIRAEIAAEQEALKQLYEHWEEAVELNS